MENTKSHLNYSEVLNDFHEKVGYKLWHMSIFVSYHSLLNLIF